MQTLDPKLIVKALKERVFIPTFFARWIEQAFVPGIEVAAMSCPRGNIKSWGVAQLAALSLRPGSPLFEIGVEVLIVSGSLEQSRIILAYVREALADMEDQFRWLDSGQRLAVTHKKTNTKLRVLSSSARRAMGLSKFSTIYGDEPGSWLERDGRLMYDALRQSIGKRPGQRLILIGTRAPGPDGGWWADLLDQGSMDGVHIEVLSADKDAPWDAWSTIRAVNPMVKYNQNLRKTILRERDQARRNASLKKSFLAYRLNRQITVESEMLIDLEDWQRVEARSVPSRVGKPIVAIDLGASRSWSAAWCLWRNGRSETYAVCPGVPELAERERQDAMPKGLYQRLHDQGVLILDAGLRVSKPSTLVDYLLSLGIVPEVIYADRFLLPALKDVVADRWSIVPRVTRWSEATEDVSGFRRLVKDGPLSIAEQCRDLARFSLSQATLKSDDQGSVRLEKKRHGRSRDDIAVTASLACGALARHLAREPNRPQRKLRYHLVTAA